jgi:hypothetical protein
MLEIGASRPPCPYAGAAYGVAEQKATAGGEWLGVSDAQAHTVLKAGRVDADPLQGSGYSPARGGPGADWGPVARPAAAPRPVWGFAGLNVHLDGTPSSSSRPLCAAPPGRRPELALDPLHLRMSTPGHLRWDDDDD